MARAPRVAGRPRHVPQRTCVACRQGKAKREMVRIVRTAEGGVRLDPTGKLAGRGAYVCEAPDCWSTLLGRGGVLPRALKIDAIPPEDLAALSLHGEQLAHSARPEGTPTEAHARSED